MKCAGLPSPHLTLLFLGGPNHVLKQQKRSRPGNRQGNSAHMLLVPLYFVEVDVIASSGRHRRGPEVMFKPPRRRETIRNVERQQDRALGETHAVRCQFVQACHQIWR